MQDVPSALAQHRFRTLTKSTADVELYQHDNRSKTISRPDRVALWHVHTVLGSSLIHIDDHNVLVGDDVAQLVHYRADVNAMTTFNSTLMKRFTSRIVNRLQAGVKTCL